MSLDKNVKRFSEGMSLLIVHPKRVFRPIRDIATAVYHSFLDMDIEVESKSLLTFNDLNKVAASGEYSHILSINTHDYLEAEKCFYLDPHRNTCLMSYNLEQTPIREQNSTWASMRLNETAAYGSYFDYIVSESECKNKDIENLGFRLLNLNLPYHPVLDLGTNPKIEDKEYDLFFIGCGSDRRQDLIKALQKEGVKMAPAPMPQSLDPNYKAFMVQKSKLCLNMHFSDMEYFEKPRIMYDYFINKGVVISEAILWPEEFINVKHLFMSKYVNMVPTVLALLSKYNEDILKVGYNAYAHFKDKYHYSKVVNRFLTELYHSEQKFRRLK